MLRELSIMEKLMWLGISNGMLVNFVVSARIKGEFSREQLQNAISAARQKHPLLAIRIARQTDESMWFASDNVPDCPIRETERKSEGTWITEMEHELSENFDWQTGPLARFVWVKGRGTSELILTCYHGASDGMSAVYVLRDVLDAMGNQTALPALPLRPAVPDMIPVSVRQSFPVRLQNFALGGVFRLAAMRPPKPGPPPLYDPSHDYRILTRAFDQAQTSALLSRCKAENTTVQAAVNAAFLLSSGSEKDHHKIHIPVNLRAALDPPVKDDFGFFISLVNIGVKIPQGKRFWDVARAARQALKQEIEGHKRFNMWLLLGLMESIGGERMVTDLVMNIVDYDLSVTNLGKLDIPTRYGELKLEALYGPAVEGNPDEKVVSVATLTGQMYFTFLFRTTAIPEAQGRAMFENALAQLLAESGL